MSEVKKDNFIAMQAGGVIDEPSLLEDLQFIVSVVFRKNRYPPSAYGALTDLVGAFYASLKEKPPRLDGEDWFVELYRQARRVVSKHFRETRPAEETVQDQNTHLIQNHVDEEIVEDRRWEVPASYEEYIEDLELDPEIEGYVYDFLENRLHKADPATMEFSLDRVVLFSIIM